ncbi:FAD-dependent monooxygenase [Mycobacterium noviomagense]|uniref:Pentachlorophenol monooxygenase n=1 Tax=Mycobacterium noviomagense TaxID=459858 RepID=A0A7I7PAB7_9MYCO|nr:FAD-dependent monooxygenase [Mycobacterium noviomagense]ORB14828.1 pentachlorophenol monooxygenase [Mycobacterium noviomagense]BBY05531.1 pentachlorophenol monooxygenase [Mycobacterium noviomagense]
MTDTDVLVVGAGPTGLTLAISLLNRGARVMIGDCLAAGANTSRAAAVNARTLEVLEGIDVSRRMVKAGLIAARFTMRHQTRILMPIDFSVLPTRYPYTLMISQATTEKLLVERLTELGGEVLRPKTLTHLTQGRDGVTAAFDDGEDIRARYVVGADGMHSTVRELAGIGFTGGEYPESFALADARLSGEAPDDEVILFYAVSGLNVLAPLPDGIHRIVAPIFDAPEEPSTEFVQSLLDARGFGPGRTQVREVLWGSRFRIHHRVADTYRAGRLVLAGDAAHVHSPAGGQGMNLGIQDAVALADALGEVLHGGSDTALDAYSAARRPIARQVLATTGRLTRLATLPKAARPIRNGAMRLAARVPAVRSGLAWRLSGLVYR